ncbi:MAG: SGNH/GDSL hydrolase family protein, partial [Proteobacteria bacterium]|nr:SGNH/GDSL hydrolase family protein [Pseudomonadota bacterium]
GYQLRAGFEGVTKFGVPLRVNSRGLRSPEIAVPKPVGMHRVLVLGDSVTFGWGVEEEQNFSRRLEIALRQQLACPVEVLNSGVAGYGTVEEADYFTHEGLEVAPDVVLIYYVENDNQSVPHATGAVASFLKDWVVYRSHLVSTVLYAWRLNSWKLHAQAAGGDRAAYEAEQRAWDTRSGTAASFAALHEIATVAQSHGMRVILASHPNSLANRSLDAVRDRLLREAAASDGMAFVDVAPAIVPYRDRDIAVSKTDLHPNGFAHGLIAEALLPAVRDALACPLATSAVH